jgi:hypothetical protein
MEMLMNGLDRREEPYIRRQNFVCEWRKAKWFRAEMVYTVHAVVWRVATASSSKLICVADSIPNYQKLHGRHRSFYYPNSRATLVCWQSHKRIILLSTSPTRWRSCVGQWLTDGVGLGCLIAPPPPPRNFKVLTKLSRIYSYSRTLDCEHNPF